MRSMSLLVLAVLVIFVIKIEKCHSNTTHSHGRLSVYFRESML